MVHYRILIADKWVDNGLTYTRVIADIFEHFPI